MHGLLQTSDQRGEGGGTERRNKTRPSLRSSLDTMLNDKEEDVYMADSIVMVGRKTRKNNKKE
jgi:hypothetical protein